MKSMVLSWVLLGGVILSTSGSAEPQPPAPNPPPMPIPMSYILRSGENADLTLSEDGFEYNGPYIQIDKFCRNDSKNCAAANGKLRFIFKKETGIAVECAKSLSALFVGANLSAQLDTVIECAAFRSNGSCLSSGISIKACRLSKRRAVVSGEGQ